MLIDNPNFSKIIRNFHLLMLKSQQLMSQQVDLKQYQELSVKMTFSPVQLHLFRLFDLQLSPEELHQGKLVEQVSPFRPSVVSTFVITDKLVTIDKPVIIDKLVIVGTLVTISTLAITHIEVSCTQVTGHLFLVVRILVIRINLCFSTLVCLFPT